MVRLVLFIADVFSKVIDVYTLILLAYALLSWFPGAYQTKIGQWIIRLADPYIAIFRRLNLQFGMIDLSVMAALISLQVIHRVGLILLASLLRLLV